MSPRPSPVDHNAGEANEALAEVVAVGGAHDVACAVVVAHLGVLIGLSARVGHTMSVTDLSPATPSGQYDATLLTHRLAEDRPADLIRVGVTELDLCLPVFSHVFGEADVGGGVALVSMHRLRTGAARSLLYERLAKVACHEVGHALGLRHCRRSGCLMRFAGHLDLLDRCALAFCPDCTSALGEQRTLLLAKQPLR